MSFQRLFLIAIVPFLMAQTQSDGFRKLELPPTSESGFQVYVSNGGADRCSTKDCLCKVKVDRPLSVVKNEADARRLPVYFSEGSSKVASSNGLKQFTSRYRDSIFTVIGYTDGCGNTTHNSELAKRRARSVKDVLSSYGAKVISDPLFKPEITEGCSAEARRVDVVAHTKNRVTTMIDKIPADVYLIDASGSMWDSMREWSDVVAASFKPNSRVYLSKTVECSSGQRLSEVKPSGGTEIWYSYWKVLDFMKDGETLVIISDFVSDIPLTRRESVTIENKVTSKGIKVIAIQL